MSVKDFVVTPCDRQEIKEFIEYWHYSNNVNGVNSPYCFKLLDKGDLIGAMMYGWISMAGVWKKYVSEEKHLIELRRLCCIDDTPKNTESYFFGQTFKMLKRDKDFEVIVSFADEHHGHTGVIYKATNFEYWGKTAGAKMLMVDGKETHSRSLNQVKRPYGRKLKRRYDAGDKNIFWKKVKHIL